MKKVFLILSVSFLACSIQAQDIFKKHGFKKETLTLSKGRYEEVFTNKEVVQIGSVLLNTKTNKVIKFLDEETEDVSFKTEHSSRWLSPDPLAEKYPWISPYAFCFNNPVRFVDPNGMDVYRYDDKTGNLVLAVKTEDKFDQIGKFKYDKKTGEYNLQTNKKGEAKTRIDNIEKGILSDGMNFKTESNLISVGGENQTSLQGVQNFIVDFSEMIGKELSGYYLADKNTDNINYVHIGKHVDNRYDKSYKGYSPHKDYPNIINNVYEHTDYHTHPSSANVNDKTQPSRQDMDSKASTQKYHPHVKRFIILTKGYYPIPY